jgi:hypothetical protein
VCAMVGAHTTNPTRGRNESHTHIGYGFLAFAVGVGVSKINLIFLVKFVGQNQ